MVPVQLRRLTDSFPVLMKTASVGVELNLPRWSSRLSEAICADSAPGGTESQGEYRIGVGHGIGIVLPWRGFVG